MKDIPDNWTITLWGVIAIVSILYFFTMLGGCIERQDIRTHELKMKVIEAGGKVLNQ